LSSFEEKKVFHPFSAGMVIGVVDAADKKKFAVARLANDTLQNLLTCPLAVEQQNLNADINTERKYEFYFPPPFARLNFFEPKRNKLEFHPLFSLQQCRKASAGQNELSLALFALKLFRPCTEPGARSGVRDDLGI
jgi:hypothetical protein